MRSLIVLPLLVIALSASAATIYKYTDANGRTVFTNSPPQGVTAQPVDAPPAPMVGTQMPSGAADSQRAGDESPYAILALGDLPTDEALRANNGTFDVEVVIQPRLSPAHRLQLLLDGQPYGQPVQDTILSLQNVDRGEHTLAAQVLMGDLVVQTSPSVSFTIQRTSTNAPTRRPAPPTPAPTPPPRPTPTPAAPSGGMR